MNKAFVVIGLFLLASLAFAQGSPHTVLGHVLRYEGDPPPDACIHFRITFDAVEYIETDPEFTYEEATGVFFLQISDSLFIPGDSIRIEIGDSCLYEEKTVIAEFAIGPVTDIGTIILDPIAGLRPELFADYVDPDTGYVTDIFEFGVTYYSNPWDRAPGTIGVWIDGVDWYNLGWAGTGTPHYDLGEPYNTTVSGYDIGKGTHDYYVYAEDDFGLPIWTTPREFVILNTRPTNPEISVDPEQAFIDEDIVASIDVVGFDEDSDVLTYYYQWYKDGDLEAGYSGFGMSTLPSAATAVGELWEVRVRSYDGEEYSSGYASALASIIAPVLTDGDVSPSTGDRATVFTYTVTYTNLRDVAPAGVYVSIDGSDPIAMSETRDYTTGAEFGYSTTLALGDHTYQFSAMDISDHDAVGDTGIHAGPTVGNNLPEIDDATLIADPEPATERSTITAVASGWFDEDGDPESYFYNWYVNDILIAYTGSSITGTYFDRGDVVYCEVVPFDGIDEGIGMNTDPVTIQNSLPGAPGVSYAPIPVFDKDDVVISIETDGYDPDGDDLDYHYAWFIDDEEVGSDSHILDDSETAPGDTINVQIWGNDGYGDGEITTIAIPVDWPTLSGGTVVPLSGSPTEIFRYEVVYTSARDIPPYIIYVNIDGEDFAMTAEDPTDMIFTDGFDYYLETTLPYGDHYYSYHGEDVIGNDALGEEDSRPGPVQDNTLPEITDIEILPYPTATEIDVVEVTAEGSDEDDDPVSFIYQWFNQDGAIVGATFYNIDGEDFDKGDTVWCQVTPYDGWDYGIPENSLEVIIVNTPPVIDYVELISDPDGWFNELGVLVAVTYTTDVDDDDLFYDITWYVNGEAVAPTPADPFELDGTHYDRGDEVYFDVTVSDDDGPGGYVVSDTVTILNAPPQFTEMFIDPAAPTTIDMLEVTADADDADGDDVTITYEWYLDDELLEDWAEDYIPSFLTEKHQVWSCIATTDDGMGGTDEAEDEVEIFNTPPEVAAIEETIVVWDIGYRTTIRALDADADRIIWRLIDGPEQLELDSLTGDLLWTDFEDVETLGVHEVSMIVTDGEDEVAVLFNLHVYPIGDDLFAPFDLDALSGYVLNVPMSWEPPLLFGTGDLLPLTFVNYEIYRSTDMTSWALIGSTPGAGFVDALVTGGTMYYYRVRAVYEEGPSDYSNIDFATPGTVNSDMLYSTFTYDPIPELDGVISDGEWADATDFTLGSQTLYIKNTENRLYLAFIDGMDVELNVDDAFYVQIEDSHNLRWPGYVGSTEGEYRLTAIDDSTSSATYQGIWGTYPGSIGRDTRGTYEEVDGAIGGGAGDAIVYEFAIDISPDTEFPAAINSEMGNIVGFRFATFDAGGLMWTREWLTGSPSTDPESFGNLMLGIGSGGPNFSVWHNFYEVTLLEGTTGTRPMWVSNLGNGSIEYTLYESYLPLWGAVTRDTDSPILLYTEEMTVGEEALAFLGYPYETVSTSSDFITAMSTEAYEAVVITLMEGLSAAELAILEGFQGGGGKVVIACPDLEGTSTHTFWDVIGMDIYEDLGSSPSALTWDLPEHAIFHTPLSVPPSVETVEGSFTDYGDAILSDGATILASFDEFPYPANGAITIGSDSSVILNSFVMSDTRDDDDDGITDGVELLINELYYLVALDDIPWLSVAPESGTLSSHETDDAVITFDATALTEGDYNGFIMATSDDPLTPLIPVPCLLHVRAPSYNLVTIALPEELQRVQPGERVRMPLMVEGLEASGVNELSMTITTNASVISPDMIFTDFDYLVTDYDLDHISFEISSEFLLTDGLLCEIEFAVAELAPIASISNLVISDVVYNLDAYVEAVETVDGRVMVEAGEMDWMVQLDFTHGDFEDLLYIGVNPLGSDLFDIDLDMPNDPPGSWFDPFSDVADLDPENPELDGDIRSAYDDVIVWSIPVGDSAGKVEWGFRDEDTLTVMGSLYLNGDIDMKTSSVYFFEPGETLTIVYRRTGEAPFVIDLYPGWNMVSLPIIPTGIGDTPGEVYPDGVQYYYFDPATQAWAEAENIEPGVGYVVLSFTEEHYTVWGQPLESYTYALSRGWDLVGSIFEEVDFSSPTTNPPGAILGVPDHAYWYDVTTTNYVSSNDLEPGKGYFAASNFSATLTVPGVSGYKVAVPEREFDAIIAVEFENEVVLLDVGVANLDLVTPIPPAIDGKSPNAFLSVDSWKATGALFADVIDCDLVLAKPAIIDISGMPDGIALDIDGEAINGRTTLSPGTYKLSVGNLPKIFALFQNAPNPFNPTTAIAFDLSKKSEVTLDIFDLLGRKVNTLVSEELSAGSHSVVWNGVDVSGRAIPSGVYFYRITAGDNTATRRMLLLK